MRKRQSSIVAANSCVRAEDEVNVGRLDSMISGSPVCLIVGPFSTESNETLARRLNDFSGGQPANRVGLIPSRETTRWKFASDYSDRAVLDRTVTLGPFADVEPDIDEVLNRLIGAPIDAPIAVMSYDGYLVLRFDHGIGDAHVLMCIVAALSGADSADLPLQAGYHGQLTTPVWHALLNVITTQRRDFLRDCIDTAHSVVRRGCRILLQRNSPPSTPEMPLAESRGDYCAVYVKSDVDYSKRLRANRDSRNLEVSLPALTLWSICRSLELAGIPVRPDVDVLVDLRKFLPSGHLTSGNFLAVSRLRYGALVDLKSFGSTFSKTISSTRPVINMIGHICVDWLRSTVFRRGASVNWSPADGESDGFATVTYSDITRLEEGRAVQWKDDSPVREFAVALPPASRSHIAILVCAPRDGQIALTASFFPSRFDPDAVRRALALAVAGCIDGESSDGALRGAT